MIERLNFYDVYGYLLPGLTFLGILWFPLWFVAGRDLPAAWSSAFVVLVLGYVAGHALGRISGLAFPHGRVLPGTSAASPGQSPAPPRRLQPSDYVLDPDDRQLAREVKDALIPLIQSRFGIDAATPANRNTAFMLCRRALLQSAVGSYAEQFEGLYTLVRGWTVVGWLSATYHLGWAIGPWLPAPLPAVAASLLALGLIAKGIVDYRRERQIRQLVRQPVPYDPWAFRLLAGFLVAIGALLDAVMAPPRVGGTPTAVLAAAAVISLLLALRFHGAYHYFADLFAVTVYRDFFVLEQYRRADNSASAAPPR